MGFLDELAGIAIRGVVGYARASLKLKKLPRCSQLRNPKTGGSRPGLFLLPAMCAYMKSKSCSALDEAKS